MSEELKPCAFCGKTESLIVGTDKEFTESEEGSGYYTVCCSAYSELTEDGRHDGGCGAHSGYAPTREEAIEKWNRRAE